MIQTYSMILTLLSPAERRRFYQILFLVFVLSLFEAASVISILPFLQVLADPGVIRENSVLAWLYDTGGFTTDRGFMIALGILVFFITVFGLVFKAGMVWLLTRFAMMRSYGLSARLLTGYLHQPYVWFLSRHSSDLGNNILSEVDRMVSGALLPAMRLIPDSLTAILLMGAVFLLEPNIAIGAVVLIGGSYAIIYTLVRRLLLRIGTIRVNANKTRFHVVQEATGGIKELKLMGLEDGFLSRFRDAAYAMAKAQTKGLVVSQLPRYALEAVAFGGMILAVLVLVVRGDGSVGAVVPTLGLIAVAGMRLFPAVQQVYNQISTIRFNHSALERIHSDITALDPERPRAHRRSEALPQLRLREQLELSDISYQYPTAEKTALRGLSLVIPANTTVGIVGGTGAGKTTLVDIILGLLQQDSGALLVDGKPVEVAQVRAWQKSLGYVPQHIFLSDASVAANIAFGVKEDDIDMAVVERTAKTASLHDFVISELAEGYATQVGERGVRLSGGQRQRIGIARALYHNPDVLIMDEATSALDNLTERAVMQAVHNIGGSKTIIMIAHRLSTVKGCDQIFLLRDGGVVASGRFDDLVAKDAEFRDMAREA